METEYKRTIFNVKRPNAKSFLVSIPMYMYRIKTKQFEYGLDFFQKAVLMLKSRPGITNTTIAACLGLDEELVDEVVNVLISSKYLTPFGAITQRGIEIRNDFDSIIVNKDKDEIGYVFQYLDRNDYYPFYIKTLGDAPNTTSKGALILGTKGDGNDRLCTPVHLEFIENSKKALPPPNDRVIFDSISNSVKNGVNAEKIPLHELRKKLSIGFLENSHEPVLVKICTYVYLPQREDGAYEPEWQVLDPFGHADSSKLKFYLESFKNPQFDKEIAKRFGDAETINRQNFNDYTRFLEEQVERIKEEEFSIEFDSLDNNLKHYILSVIKGIFTLREYNYADSNSGEMFIINCQKALETVFLLDEENRISFYTQVKEDYSTPKDGNRNDYCYKRKNAMSKLIWTHVITISNPQRLIGLSFKFEPNRASSLKQYIYNFLLTYYYDNKSPLFKLVNGNIDKMFAIAELRNKKGHGQTENEGLITTISKDVAEDTFSFIKDFFNNYMTV